MSVAPPIAEPVTLLLQPRDPIIVRDARPFSADPGARAETLAWPLPRTLAGALRAHAGRALDWAFDNPSATVRNEASKLAFRVAVAGPLLLGRRSPDAGWTIYVPAPRDAVPYLGDQAGATEAARHRLLCLRPWENLAPGAGCVWPEKIPDTFQPLHVEDDIKPAGATEFWSLAEAHAWLLARSLADWRVDPALGQWPSDTVARIPRETRVHVKIDAKSGTADEGYLFATEALAFRPRPMSVPAEDDRGAGGNEPETAMLCRVTMPDDLTWPPAPALIPFGGERRLAALAAPPASEVTWPEAPAAMIEALTGAKRLRLQLVTPAFFNGGGWRPDWLTEEPLTGVPPGISGLRLKLVAAAVGRRIAVSGWSLQYRRERATRYAVPAGSVLFFTVERDKGLTEDEVHALWLGSLCQDRQDRNDGFGLALPGLW